MNEPFIGITSEVEVLRRHPEDYILFIDHRYAEMVKDAGGYPVMLPIARRPAIVQRYLDGIDGLIIVGGDDVDPRLYGERPRRGTGTVFKKRLEFEIKLYRGAQRMGIPILGVCYGMQLINVLEGGTLFQDIRRDARSTRNHRDRRHPDHSVRIEAGSRLGRIYGKRTAVVHSEHHQAVSRLAPGFRAVAYAPDGIVEAIENEDRSLLAVQWHPECKTRSAMTRRLLAYFIKQAAVYARAP